MSNYLQAIIIDYKSKGIIIDTNLLILYIVGIFDIDYIEKFKRVKDKQYTREDFLALMRLVNPFQNIYVTPHVLSEISNLTFNCIKDKKFLLYFQEVITIISSANEEYISKDTILKMPELAKFGFTDSSILELARKNDLPVITDDFKLYQLLLSNNIKGINMDIIRFN